MGKGRRAIQQLPKRTHSRQELQSIVDTSGLTPDQLQTAINRYRNAGKSIQRPPNGIILDVMTKEESYSLGFVIGNEFSNTYHILAGATERLGWIITGIAENILATEGLSPASQSTQMLNLLTAKSQNLRLDKRILVAVYDLREALEEYLEAKRAGLQTTNPTPIDSIDYDMQVRVAILVARRVRVFMRQPNQDSMNQLRLAVMDASDIVTSIAAIMRDNAKKTGRKSQPTPITAFILERTAYLRQLHGLRTRGEEFDWLVKELESMQVVQNWNRLQGEDNVADTAKRNLQKQPVEVQAYERLGAGKLNRQEGAEILRIMRRDNPDT